MMLEVQISEEVKKLAPGLKLGILIFKNVNVKKENAGLAAEFSRLQREIGEKFTLEGLGQDEIILATRAMYKALKMDPARYRPASEAMRRRIIQGKGLYTINTVVDVNNLGSVKFALPFGVYNLAKIQPPVILRMGRAGETYRGITGNPVNAEGKLVLADREKICGSPTTDSVDTKVDLDVKDLFLVIYTPAAVSDAYLKAAIAYTAEKMVEFNGGECTENFIVRA